MDSLTLKTRFPATTPKSLDIDKMYKRCLCGTEPNRITARTVYDYCISPFMVYCEKFAPEDKKDPSTRYTELLLEQGKTHEAQVIKERYSGAKKFKYRTPEEGFRMLLEGMKSGSNALCGLPAFYLPEGLMGVFDVAERTNTHPSIFGNYHYVVKEIKLAKNIRDQHKYQGAFYNYLLGKIQAYTPTVFHVINRDCKEIEVSYNETALKRILEDARSILNGRKVSPTYAACRWPWETYNNEEAKKARDVSLVAGVGPSLKQKLAQRGIRTVENLAKARTKDLLQINGICEKTAKKLSLNAKTFVSGKHVRLGACNFPRKTTEIFLDLEGTGEQMGDEELIAMDYLIGTLTRKGGKETYTPFVARGFDKEKYMFNQFLRWLQKQDDFIIYHWHHYERVHLKRLATRYAPREEVSNLLFKNMRDLCRDAASNFVFPTHGNGLKQIANYLGHRWKHQDINALESIALYFEYTNNPRKNRKELQKVIDYNEDDCRATMLIKDWLEHESNS